MLAFRTSAVSVLNLIFQKIKFSKNWPKKSILTILDPQVGRIVGFRQVDDDTMNRFELPGKFNQSSVKDFV